MIKTAEEFKIRAYTKVELACLYNPYMTIPGALRTLARWIAGNSQLTAELCVLESIIVIGFIRHARSK